MLLLATCAPGLADILAGELDTLGLAPGERTAGGVFFEGTLADVCRANLRLRTASRVQRILARVRAETDEDLDALVAAVDWRATLRPDRALEVEVIDTAATPEDAAARGAEIRRLVAERLSSPAALRADDEHAIRLVVHRHRGLATLGLDTSGKALHKRGYRGATTHAAPLQATLAAALLLRAGYDGGEPFHDPMCGSGTIAIEAAMIAVRKPPLMHRKKGDFAFEWLRDFDNATWRAAQEAARRERRDAPEHPVLGSDADEKSVADAVAGAERARVGHQMRLFQARIEELEPQAERGLLLANLPYGERLAARHDLPAFYRRVGKILRERFASWRVGLLAPDEPFASELGIEAGDALRVRNGAIECVFLERPARS